MVCESSLREGCFWFILHYRAVSAKKNMKKDNDYSGFHAETRKPGLYHEYAEKCPILDYHCISTHRICCQPVLAKHDSDLAQRDHYKWRAMRPDGVNERYCTGSLDWKSFQKGPKQCPSPRNPLITGHILSWRVFRHYWQTLNNHDSERDLGTMQQKAGAEGFPCRTAENECCIGLYNRWSDRLLSITRRSKRTNQFRSGSSAWRPDKGMAVDNRRLSISGWINWRKWRMLIW